MTGQESFPKKIELNVEARNNILQAFFEFSEDDLVSLGVSNIRSIDFLKEGSLNKLKELFEAFCSSEKGIEIFTSFGVGAENAFAIVLSKSAEKLGEIELDTEE